MLAPDGCPGPLARPKRREHAAPAKSGRTPV
jgi:hypothetical protein